MTISCLNTPMKHAMAVAWEAYLLWKKTDFQLISGQMGNRGYTVFNDDDFCRILEQDGVRKGQITQNRLKKSKSHIFLHETFAGWDFAKIYLF